MSERGEWTVFSLSHIRVSANPPWIFLTPFLSPDFSDFWTDKPISFVREERLEEESEGR
jgi:hypothetical protein